MNVVHMDGIDGTDPDDLTRARSKVDARRCKRSKRCVATPAAKERFAQLRHDAGHPRYAKDRCRLPT